MRKQKDLEIEIEKVCYLKTIPVTVIEEAIYMVKYETDEHVNKIPGFVCLVWWVLWHINLCRLFKAKSIFM